MPQHRILFQHSTPHPATTPPLNLSHVSFKLKTSQAQWARQQLGEKLDLESPRLIESPRGSPPFPTSLPLHVSRDSTCQRLLLHLAALCLVLCVLNTVGCAVCCVDERHSKPFDARHRHVTLVTSHYTVTSHFATGLSRKPGVLKRVPWAQG
jgi:hypothetical protein